MNDNQLDNLKQFINDRISQTETHMAGKIENLITKMDQRFDKVWTDSAETISISNEQIS